MALMFAYIPPFPMTASHVHCLSLVNFCTITIILW